MSRCYKYTIITILYKYLIQLYLCVYLRYTYLQVYEYLYKLQYLYLNSCKNMITSCKTLTNTCEHKIKSFTIEQKHFNKLILYKRSIVQLVIYNINEIINITMN